MSGLVLLRFGSIIGLKKIFLAGIMSHHKQSKSF